MNKLPKMNLGYLIMLLLHNTQSCTEFVRVNRFLAHSDDSIKSNIVDFSKSVFNSCFKPLKFVVPARFCIHKASLSLQNRFNYSHKPAL